MLKRIALTLPALLVPALVFAQDEPPPGGGPSGWLGYVALAISTVLIPLVVNVVRPLWAGLPAIVKTLVPTVVGPLLVTGGAYLSQLLGAPVDLTALEQIWMGVSAGAAASFAFKKGDAHGMAK